MESVVGGSRAGSPWVVVWGSLRCMVRSIGRRVTKPWGLRRIGELRGQLIGGRHCGLTAFQESLNHVELIHSPYCSIGAYSTEPLQPQGYDP